MTSVATALRDALQQLHLSKLEDPELEARFLIAAALNVPATPAGVTVRTVEVSEVLPSLPRLLIDRARR